ncbi:MAG: LPS assembly lipoprotein LptE [Nitrospiraceae bacterium]|nr:LPS assembly lipoprotein LptE [Nitrospiraceae bacterium]
MRKSARSIIVYIFLFSFIAVLLTGCGYSFVGRKNLKATSVSIGPIANNTTEPGLEQYLYTALSDELMKQGIDVDQTSANKIYGSLDTFQLLGVAETNRVFTSYQVTISGKFIFRGTDGKEVPLAGASPFIISFSAQGDLNDVLAQRQLAIRTGMQSFASQIVSGLVTGP